MDPLCHLKLHEAHDSDLSRCSCLAGPQKTSPLHQPNPGALHPLSLNSVENAKFLEGNHVLQALFNHHSTTNTRHLSNAPPRQHCRNSISRATRSAFFRCVAGSFCGSMVVEYWERSSWQIPLKNGRFHVSPKQKKQLIWVMKAKKIQVLKTNTFSKQWDFEMKPKKTPPNVVKQTISILLPQSN